MSTNTKVILGVVVVVVIAGLAWWMTGANTTGTQTASQNTANQPVDQQMANVDAQLNGLTSDSATIDQGLNDQPVQQQQL